MKKEAEERHISRNSSSSSLSGSSSRFTSFAKAERFPKQHIPPHFLIRHKSEPHQQTHRINFPKFQQAERAFFFEQQKELCLNPSPQTYNITFADEIRKIEHKGPTLGSRFNLIGRTTAQGPGPWQYSKRDEPIRKSFNKTSTFQRSRRTLNEVFERKGKDSPGPIYNTIRPFVQKSPPKKQQAKEVKPRRIPTEKKQIPLRMIRLPSTLLDKEKPLPQIAKPQKKPRFFVSTQINTQNVATIRSSPQKVIVSNSHSGTKFQPKQISKQKRKRAQTLNKL